MQRVIELYPGTAIYKVHLDSLRERSINARVQEREKFERLAANIAEDKRLESLPLCRLNPNRPNELEIISGHHRTRAARVAGVLEIYVLVIEEDLTEDAVSAKQLAHNALNGHDDPATLQAIYNSIKDLNERLRSGISEIENVKFKEFKLSEVNFEFNFEVVTIMFLPSKLKKFEEAISRVLQSKQVFVSEFEEFESLKSMLRAVQKHDNIRNISGVLSRMSEIVIDYYCKQNQQYKKDAAKN